MPPEKSIHNVIVLVQISNFNHSFFFSEEKQLISWATELDKSSGNWKQGLEAGAE